MRKWELIVAAILAILLGGGIIFLFNGNSRVNETNPLKITDSPTPVIENSGISVSGLTQTPENSQEKDRIASPTPDPNRVEKAKSPDMADLLLLYSSRQPGIFDFNYCHIGELYGLICKKIDLENTNLTDQNLRDDFGEYFKLIGVDAVILQQEPALLSKGEIDVLKTAIGTGKTNLLIYNMNQKIAGSNLSSLVDGTLISVNFPVDSQRDWNVSNDAPEITQEFSGKFINSNTTASQIDFALNIDPKATITPLILSKDDTGRDYLIFARMFIGAGSIFLNAGAPGWGLDTRSFNDTYYSPAHFSEIVPLMLTIRYTFGEEVWHNIHNYANLIIIAPFLTEPSENLNFQGLLEQMKAHNFHTTIALPPVNWEKSDFNVTSLFIQNPDRYSLAQYGNNAEGYEFYQYTTSADDPNPATPLADQEWDILEGLSRMEMLAGSTGIPVDRVMIFPQGISPEETLVFLKKRNYLASVNAQNIPLGVTLSENVDNGIAPISLTFGNFPLLTWTSLGVRQPFQPVIQPFLFDLFMGKPVLLISNVYDKGLFATGIDAFNPIADLINQISGGVTWSSLGDVIKRTYLEKVNDDGSVDVRMFTNAVILANDFGGERIYHISKEETMNVPIKNITMNGQEIPYLFEDDAISWNVKIMPYESVEILINYGN